MAEDRAEELFHGKERYNCAQAVLKAFEGELNITKEQILSAARKGSGRAEEGLCGALYAARLLVDNEGAVKDLNMAFEKEGGSTECRQIRKLNKLSCRGCVRLAAKSVEHYLLEKV